MQIDLLQEDISLYLPLKIHFYKKSINHCTIIIVRTMKAWGLRQTTTQDFVLKIINWFVCRIATLLRETSVENCSFNRLHICVSTFKCSFINQLLQKKAGCFMNDDTFFQFHPFTSASRMLIDGGFCQKRGCPEKMKVMKSMSAHLVCPSVGRHLIMIKLQWPLYN